MSDTTTLKNTHSLETQPAHELRAQTGDELQQEDILVFAVTGYPCELEDEWRELETRSNISVYQRYDWIDACISTLETELDAKPLIVTGRRNGELVFILPLVVEGGFVPKTRWIGGNHSNYNMALIDNSFRKTLSISDVEILFQQAVSMLPGAGYLKLCCQPLVWENQINPMQAITHQRSTNVALGMDLRGGFENVLASVNGKRKRKKFRSQTRAVEGLGGAKLVEAKSEGEAFAILNCFYTQKSERFRDQGLKDVFGGLDTRQFLEKIAVESLDSKAPLLKLFALEIDGKYRAICGGGVSGKHFSAYFTSFANDELAHISPGEMLLYMMVERFCSSHFHSLDLGCGEERYKRSWCTNTYEMFDIIHPLSSASTGHVVVQRWILILKRGVRENHHLWEHFKRARVLATKTIDFITRK